MQFCHAVGDFVFLLECICRHKMQKAVLAETRFMPLSARLECLIQMVIGELGVSKQVEFVRIGGRFELFFYLS